jgi:FdrA protein
VHFIETRNIGSNPKNQKEECKLTTQSIVKTSEYHDSVSLMAVARELSNMAGVVDAAVVMGTAANKAILAQANLLTPQAEAATPNDLIIVVNASPDVVDGALSRSEQLLKPAREGSEEKSESQPRSIHSAVKKDPEANVAVISVAGRYAAGEAWKALHKGLHVLLFSDNVSLEDEIALKKYARDRGLLLIGPGAGTVILNGVALGFANVVPAGPIGIVSAAGTGLQEVSTLIAKNGLGITQGIGTGGRDLKEDVGGIMMLEGLKALQADPNTKVIALVSKPPSKGVAEAILDQVASGDKPTIVGFMGANPEEYRAVPNAIPAKTLELTALLAARAAGAKIGDPFQMISIRTAALKSQAEKLCAGLKLGQKYLRGLYTGGTLCYEAQVIWRDMLDTPVLSNAPLRKADHMPDSIRSEGNCTVDLGEEEFTVGRPHPMIDNDLRIRRLLQEARDPSVAVIIMDVVLGYGAHPDPAAELGPAIQKAKQIAQAEGREIPVVVSVTGTEEDPQVLSRQVKNLKDAGAIVCDSNAMAAQLAGFVVA